MAASRDPSPGVCSAPAVSAPAAAGPQPSLSRRAFVGGGVAVALSGLVRFEGGERRSGGWILRSDDR